MFQKKLLPLHRPKKKLSSLEDINGNDHSDKSEKSLQLVTSANVVGDAVGVSERKWFMAFVNNNTEKSCSDKLQEKGYETYIATQKETRLWRNGRRSQVERVVIPSIVFIHATEHERLNIVKFPFVKRFVTDRACMTNEFGRHPIAVIPSRQMDMLKYMLYQSDTQVFFASHPPCSGENIRVVRGHLKGLEGKICRYHDGDTYLSVQVSILGCAVVRVALADIEILI